MTKDNERRFLETLSGALVSLPFDLKILIEAAADADLDRPVREIAVAAVVHALTPKDGQVEPPLRYAEDVILCRLALQRIARDGGEGAEGFRGRFPEIYERLSDELDLFRGGLGDIVDWLDGRWDHLRRAVYAKKKVAQYVDDDDASTFLYDEGLEFGTNYPVTEKYLQGKVKQVQPFVDHMRRKREEESKRIVS